jgi:hypothetical protein
VRYVVSHCHRVGLFACWEWVWDETEREEGKKGRSWVIYAPDLSAGAAWVSMGNDVVV